MIGPNGKIMFTNEIELLSLSGAKPLKWLDAWTHRIDDYYLKPATAANNNGNGFVSLNLMCAAIEAIATVLDHDQKTLKGRFTWTTQRMLNMDLDKSETLYKQYRCGLTHNGRTNQSPRGGLYTADMLSVIDFASQKILAVEKADQIILITVNPVLLAKQLERSFRDMVHANRQSMAQTIVQEFREDLETAEIVEKFRIRKTRAG